MRSLQSAQAFNVYTPYCIQLPLYTNIVREWARVDSQGMGRAKQVFESVNLQSVERQQKLLGWCFTSVCIRRCLSLERTYVFGAASMFVDAIDLRIKVDMPNKIE